MTPDDARWVVGIDLGGTNLRAAAVDASGEVLEHESEPVERSAGAARGSFAQMTDLVSRLIARRAHPPDAIGLGATGPVDRRTGEIDNPYTLPPALQGPVVPVLSRAFGLPVVVENDADASALGESWRGAGRGYDAVVALTVGTGVGVGYVRGGRVSRGTLGAHGEAGHMLVDPAGPRCYCGARGCLESLASGSAIADRAREAGLIDGPRQGAVDVHRLARAGDTTAAQIVEAARTALGLGAWNLAATLAPGVIVLAGNALGDPAVVRDHVAASLDRFTLSGPVRTELRSAGLGDLAGCVGAARAALDLRI